MSYQPRFVHSLETPPAPQAKAIEHFSDRLAFETDPWDLSTDLAKGSKAMVVVDCRPAEEYAKAHLPGALNIPHRSITAESTAHIPRDKVVVTYCTSIHCNASSKGALRFARLGFQVKELSGGIEGWLHEGHPVEHGLPPDGKTGIPAAE